MPYERLLREGRIRRHRTNWQEIVSPFVSASSRFGIMPL
jgi:hypothetical protein